jgi:hypothetical protein
MAIEPAPGPELGTRIVFVGSTKGEHLTLDVDQNPPVVGQLVSSGGFSRLTTEDIPIWVNVANVLYVHSVKLVD